MKDYDLVHFYKSSEIFDKAAEIFAREKEFLQKGIPNADIQHVGSCAVPGVIGKFDVDIQIRVSRDQFDSAREFLKKNYSTKHENLHNQDFGIFSRVSESGIEIDCMLTVIGSPHDDFYITRDFLIANPDFLQEYNNLKFSYEGRPYHEYRAAKKEFLGGNGNLKFLKH